MGPLCALILGVAAVCLCEDGLPDRPAGNLTLVDLVLQQNSSSVTKVVHQVDFSVFMSDVSPNWPWLRNRSLFSCYGANMSFHQAPQQRSCELPLFSFTLRGRSQEEIDVELFVDTPLVDMQLGVLLDRFLSIGEARVRVTCSQIGADSSYHCAQTQPAILSQQWAPINYSSKMLKGDPTQNVTSWVKILDKVNSVRKKVQAWFESELQDRKVPAPKQVPQGELSMMRLPPRYG